MRKYTNCIDCSKQINYLAKRCKPCNGKQMLGQKNHRFGKVGTNLNKKMSEEQKLKISRTKILNNIAKYKNNPNWKDGIRNKKNIYNLCSCNNKKLKKSKNCKKCFIKNIPKGKNHPRYIDGRSYTKFFCIDCKKEINRNKIRCKKCKNNNQSNIFRGKNSHFYKDGRTSLKELIRGLFEYKQWRKQVFQRDNYTCVNCGIISKGNIEADHIKPFSFLIGLFLAKYSQFSPIEDKETLVRLAESYAPFWDIDNGRTLCHDCHKKTDTYAEKAKNYKEVTNNE